MDLTGIGSVMNFAKGLIDRVFPPDMSAEDKAKAVLAAQELVEAREKAVIEAQKAIIVAELEQGDAYTKRARPTVVYMGLFFIFLVHVAFPIVKGWSGQPIPDLALPEAFWWAWSGVVGAWVIGRSAEKRGSKSDAVKAITGKSAAKQ